MKKYIYLILILILAACLRLYAISDYPAGLNADEAALGYNAYSLLVTGRDEHGHLLPVNLESFADFKPALYSYLLVPSVKMFDLTEFAVRLPSALFGVLAVFLIYGLCRYLGLSVSVSLLSGLLLAVSPWHLQFSRGAWEVNLSTTLLMLGTVFFLKWQKSLKSGFLSLFTVSFVLSMYTYQSARVLAPLLGLGLAVIYKKTLFDNLKQVIKAGIWLLVLLTPLGYSLVATQAASRLSGVGLLADEGPVNFVRELRGQHSAGTMLIARIFHNRPVIYTIQFVKNYLSHFDGNFLFVNGDEIPRNRVPETGLLYFTDFVLLFFGLAYISRQLAYNNNRRPFRLILYWLVIAPTASALTFQVPNALRSQDMVIPLTVIMACGAVWMLESVRKYRSLLTLLLLLTYSWQFARYLHQYYVHYPQTYPQAWEYGFKDLVGYVRANQNRYERILVTDKYDQPYILFLFYLKYPPALFQGHHELSFRDQYNFSTVREFDKYVFTDTSWDLVRDLHGTLIAAAGDDIPEVGVNVVKTIDFPNGRPAFKIVSN